MSITLYKTLVAIAETGSFAAAADKVYVSQAAIGQQMKRLEDQLQITLFDRSQRTPRLNQTGWALVPKAKELVRAYDTILDGVAGDAAFGGEFNLGAVSSTIRRLIPTTVRRLLETYPELRVHVTSALSGDLQTQVERGVIDAAVLSSPEALTTELEWHPFADEELVLVTSPEVTDTDPTRILAEQPFVRHARDGMVGVLADTWLARNGIRVRYAMEMKSLEDLTSMVAHNLGVSIVPNLCMPDPEFGRLRKIPLDGKPVSRALGVLLRADSPRKRLINLFVDEIRTSVAQRPVAHSG
ncbi:MULTISPECIES: LysR family transcriptional regulator [unclassified Ruegeria]|uniref:LysR family transcriptional regulator n=1 Tax=unclassified Ruegeria TaxID=2625375 RepID=UPI0014913C61|nr:MULTISPECIES: LysR family transcriptional regulator [unclassified Ruegeria]NOD89943.1 LysR family transcriptional regulator [Ruegeria sp. HKCCD4318]NOE14611.1 LysR family transcriptional regulator [Ruegeria sp. HKCCD4318-2]NOG11035.1 LysR family transcriptional regulator [Ruegeria sp. HKCCD4315]